TLCPKLRILVYASFAGLVLCACSSKQSEAETQHAAEKSEIKAGPNDKTLVLIDSPTQKLLGVQVEPLKRIEVSPQIKGYGRVLDPAPLVTVVAEVAPAEAAARASQAEL